jgi:hypothetical protein
MVGGGALLAMWRAVRSRLSPERREQRRRLDLNAHGRLGDALLTECDDNTLYYTYQVRGVHYAASQDVSSLREQLPGSPERLGGMVNMKYAAQNPANSILLCEEWSGLRAAPRAADASAPSANGAALEAETALANETAFANGIALTSSTGLANATALAHSDRVGHQAQDSTLTQSS